MALSSQKSIWIGEQNTLKQKLIRKDAFSWLVSTKREVSHELKQSDGAEQLRDGESTEQDTASSRDVEPEKQQQQQVLKFSGGVDTSCSSNRGVEPEKQQQQQVLKFSGGVDTSCSSNRGVEPEKQQQQQQVLEFYGGVDTSCSSNRDGEPEKQQQQVLKFSSSNNRGVEPDKQQQVLKFSGCNRDGEPEQQMLKFIGGVDVSFVKEDPSIACAALVVVDAETLDIVYEDFEMTTLRMPYIPGFLAFREAPALMQLINRMAKEASDKFPQLLMVDGNGVLHPRGFGLASHLGVLADVPTIGIGKTLFEVDGLDERAIKRKSKRVLLSGGEWMELKGVSGKVWGAALRSTSDCVNPIFVSIGHRISLETAVSIVRACCNFRVPEPVRLADKKSREFLKKSGYCQV